MNIFADKQKKNGKPKEKQTNETSKMFVNSIYCTTWMKESEKKFLSFYWTAAKSREQIVPS